MSSETFEWLCCRGPNVSSVADVSALLLHSRLIDCGFLYLGPGDDAAGTPSGMPGQLVGNDGSLGWVLLPHDWNASPMKGGAYSFRYKAPARPPILAGPPKDPQSDNSKTHTLNAGYVVCVKAICIGDVLAVHAVDSRHPDETLSAEIRTNEYKKNAITTLKECRENGGRLTIDMLVDKHQELLEKMDRNIIDKVQPLGPQSSSGRESAAAHSGDKERTDTRLTEPPMRMRDPLRIPGRVVPDGNLIGPNHPMFGYPGIPGGMHSPGIRVDPFGPLDGEPDVDFLGSRNMFI